jgi:hypothetical protein
MKMPIGNLPAVIAEFFSSAVLPAASAAGGAAPFATAFIGGLIARRAPELVTQHLPALQALGVVDAEGKLDIELLYGEAVKAMEKGTPTILGYRVDREDLEKLKDIMQKHGD